MVFRFLASKLIFQFLTWFECLTSENARSVHEEYTQKHTIPDSYDCHWWPTTNFVDEMSTLTALNMNLTTLNAVCGGNGNANAEIQHWTNDDYGGDENDARARAREDEEDDGK